MNNGYSPHTFLFRSRLAPGLPALLWLLTVGFLKAQDPAPSSPQAPAAAAAPALVAGGSLTLDFQNGVVGELPDGLMVTDGEAKFSITADGSNKMLEMAAAPIVDGGVLLGESIKGPATVRVRVKAQAKRRSFPRFGVGLHGVGGFRCLVVPAMKEIQIVKADAVEARVPFAWKAGAWTMVEFSVLTAAAGGGSTLEARVWEEGQPRPEAPQLTHAVPTPPATGKASLWAAPYAELPIAFDDVVVTAGP